MWMCTDPFYFSFNFYSFDVKLQDPIGLINIGPHLTDKRAISLRPLASHTPYWTAALAFKGLGGSVQIYTYVQTVNCI
ncbi:hypothetical protein VN97_g1316 [Penicillium thymicola]|uniref:Uncharacterized protein n=1 Tax=Penicillium thymicola TaxID=293382 RepID=A0AAI9TR66_PENTH|nr:hypothetical protein VN97_g1316 [Penicillium thymicola]